MHKSFTRACVNYCGVVKKNLSRNEVNVLNHNDDFFELIVVSKAA